MRQLSFWLFSYMLTAVVYAGPEDKWVYVGSASPIDGIALLLGVAAFAWVYTMYKDVRGKTKRGK